MADYGSDVGLVNGGNHIVFRPFHNRTVYKMAVWSFSQTILCKKEKFSLLKRGPA
jgi:hypothetical protein